MWALERPPEPGGECGGDHPPESPPAPVVAYILKKFPVLSETFILGELLALEERGLKLHVFSLQRPNDPRFHEDLSRLKALVTYVPELSEIRKLINHNRRMPHSYRRGYRKALLYALSRARPQLWWRLLQAGYVAGEARRLGVTHFHAQFANRPTTVAHLASRISGLPFSFTAHATDIFKSGVSRAALAQKVRAARFVVTVSEFNKRYLEDTCGVPRDKVVRIYNGIDLGRFCPNGVPPARPFRIVCVARLVEKKGLPVLVDAAARLRDRGMDFTIVVIGKGRQKTPLRNRIRAAGLEDHMHLAGPKTQLEVLEQYRRSHLAVLPAIVSEDGNREGLPVSITEALACGLPVVSTTVTGIPEVVEEGVNGLLVPPGDPIALADALEAVMRDPELHRRLASGARASVTGRFDRRTTADALDRLFRGETM